MNVIVLYVPVPVDEALGRVVVNTTKHVIGHIVDLSC